MKHFTKKLALLTLLAGLCGSAWAQTTYFSQNYEADGVTADWSTANSGRFTPVILEENGNHYLSVTQSERNNNGTTINGNTNLGANIPEEVTDFTLSFDVKISSSTNQSPTKFIVYDSESAEFFSLYATGTWTTKWRVFNNQNFEYTLPNTNKGNSAQSIADVPWYSIVLTYSNGKLFFSISDRTNGTLIADKVIIPYAGTSGRVGKMSFVTSRYFANFALDNIVVRSVLNSDVPAAAPTTYTINYLYNNSIISSKSGESLVGEIIEAENPITIEGQKYFAVENATTSMTLSSDGTNELNVNLRKANTYTYTVSSSLGTTIASGNVTEGESVTIPYPQYELKDGTLYEAQKYDDSKKQYRHTYNFTENTETTIEYNETNITNVVYFSEAEKIEGATPTSAGSNMATRSSNAACGYATEDITLVNLPAGAYKAVMVCYSNSSGGATTHFQFGEEAYDAIISGANNWVGFNKEFTLVSPADVKWLTSGDSKNGLDYIYIVRTGDVEYVDVAVTAGGKLEGKFYATYSNADQALDFSAVDGLTAYYVTSATTSNITIEEVEKVPAGAAVLIAGAEATTYQVPVIPNFESTETNLLQVSDGEKTGDGQTIYVLGKGQSGVGFYLKKKGSAIAAGKAYLEIEDEGTSGVKSFLSLGGDDAVAISNVEAELQGTGILYNLNGQRVAAPVKGGLYIMNGKKVLVK